MKVRPHLFLRALGSACFALPTFCLGAPADAQAVLKVTAKGTIDPSCSISVQSPFPTANLASSGNVAGAALINCNKGFVIKATSAKGAATSSASASAGFTNSLAYSFDLSLPLDGGGTPLTASCGSAALVAGQSSCSLSPAGPGLNSGGKTAINQTAALKVSWTLPTTPKLISGSYSDTLTVSVAAAP